MNIAILAGIIILAGILGGAANFYLEKTDGPSFMKSVLLGLTASAAVPLFLNTVSSSLLSDCLDKQNPGSFFVFFGFCTVAAIFSSKFLQTLGDKLLQEVNEVKQKQEELSETTDVLVAQNSDPVDAPASDNDTKIRGANELESFKEGDAAGAFQAMNEEQKIMRSLQSGKFAFRTVEGIAKDSGMSAGEVQSTLIEMETKGRVKKTRRARDGATVWTLK